MLALPPDKSWAVACHMHLPGSGHTRASAKEPI